MYQNSIRNLSNKIILVLMTLCLLPQLAAARSTKSSLSKEQRDLRIQHARELLGKHYRKSVVKSGESVKKVNNFVYRRTKEYLPQKHKHLYQKVAQTIIDESLKHELDPIFLLSMILGESSFNPDCIGPVGEIGLMQIRPTTGRWIAELSGLQYSGREDLRNPVSNIKIGAAFVKHLRETFNPHAQLYLAAYNMGQGNVNKALSKKIWPKDYPLHIMKKYVELYTSLNEESSGTESVVANDNKLEGAKS